MIQHFTALLTRPSCRQALLLLLVLLLHGAVIAAVFWPVTPVAESVVPPALQGVLVQNVAVQEQLPQEIVEEPPPEPPKQETPPPQEKPPVTIPESDKGTLAPPPEVEPRKEPPPPVPAQPQAPPQPEVLPVQQKPAAAPVKMPDAHAAHLQNPAPVYPVLSRKRREQGTVILRLLVLVDGKVADISIHQSSGYPRLDESAVQAVKRWRYTPAVQEGKAIDYWHLQPVVFSIN